MEEYINQLKVMLKVRKEQKEIIECSGGSCCNCNPDIQALEQAIEIMEQYLQLKKEKEELERKYIWRKLRYDRLVKENRKLKENKDILQTNYETLRGDIQMVVNELGFPEDTIISDEFVPMIKEKYIPKAVIREKIETKCQELQHRTNIEKILESEFQRLKKEILGEEK